MLHLKSSSFDWALNHVLRFGDTDVLPTPFEYSAIQFGWDTVRAHLEKVDLYTWKVRPHRSLVSPKGRYAFRVITQLDPLDFILYAALIYEIAPDLERVRIPKEHNTVFSYRIAPLSDGQLFDLQIGYGQFLAQTQTRLSHTHVSHVALADIADFYHRIYHHRLEGNLSAATGQANHLSALKRLLSQWNTTETFGIPVGNAPSRILAEIVLSDVDDALLAHKFNFIRYNDDYRFFCKSADEGYRILAILADTLFKNHGLTLAPQKTVVLTREDFERKHFTSPEDREVTSLNEKFEFIISELGLAHPYEYIEYDDLNDEQKALVDSLNLTELLDEEIRKADAIDFSVVKFVLRRITQLGDDSLVDEVLRNLDKLYPVFPDVVQYFSNLRDLKPSRYHEIGQRVLKLLKSSVISELEYHRIWGLDLFTHGTQWGNEDRFIEMLSEARDQSTRRKLILALGRAKQRHWFQSQWRNFANESPWPRRALLAGASCMTSDARNHWYKSIFPQLDELEKAVVLWAKDHPF
jgi:Reverse transcriptase (RNA-dependent DNA polymerase)